jgi:hypothetical protein
MCFVAIKMGRRLGRRVGVGVPKDWNSGMPIKVICVINATGFAIFCVFSSNFFAIVA